MVGICESWRFFPFSSPLFVFAKSLLMPSLLCSLNSICICCEASFFISVIFMSIISHSLPAAVLKMIVFAWKCQDRVMLLHPC